MVKEDKKFFFNNIPIFTRFNQPGTRKILLVGEPGTGKTALCAEISKDDNSKYSIVFCKNV